MEKVNWQDVEDFIYWYEKDKHNFDIHFDKTNEFDGYVDVRTGKRYTVKELFDYWIKHIK